MSSRPGMSEMPILGKGYIGQPLAHRRCVSQNLASLGGRRIGGDGA
jgi:hypothetical protein